MQTEAVVHDVGGVAVSALERNALQPVFTQSLPLESLHPIYFLSPAEYRVDLEQAASAERVLADHCSPQSAGAAFHCTADERSGGRRFRSLNHRSQCTCRQSVTRLQENDQLAERIAHPPVPGMGFRCVVVEGQEVHVERNLRGLIGQSDGAAIGEKQNLEPRVILRFQLTRQSAQRRRIGIV